MDHAFYPPQKILTTCLLQTPWKKTIDPQRMTRKISTRSAGRRKRGQCSLEVRFINWSLLSKWRGIFLRRNVPVWQHSFISQRHKLRYGSKTDGTSGKGNWLPKWKPPVWLKLATREWYEFQFCTENRVALAKWLHMDHIHSTILRIPLCSINSTTHSFCLLI